MNILVSYNWLKEYLKTDLTPEEFAVRVSLCGPSIERIHYQDEKLENIFVGKILGIEKHPNADKLRLVELDLGNPTSPRLRGARKKIKVVCGGSNLRGGMKVAVALSGAKVRWHGTGELLELKPTEIRGVESHGMICASDEIGLGTAFSKKEEKEIMDLDGLEAAPGTPLAKALNSKDEIFDIEVTTNRPDMMCVAGLAREAGTILKSTFVPPEIKSIKSKEDGSLKVKVEAGDLCYRYQAVVIDGVKIKESPWWLKQRLISAGRRPINNIVDITNYVLLEMGQPLHAFDYDKLEGKKIIVRRAKKGEKMKALDGEDYKLNEEILVIADSERPSAIAGVMGGERTGVTEKTTTIVLESAVFNPVSIRKTARVLNLHSEASNLFEKGLPTEVTTAVLSRAVNLIMQIAGGEIKSKIFDERSKPYKPVTISVSASRVNSMIGAELKTDEMKDILERLGFIVSLKGDEIKAKAPYWREGDMEIEEDLVEEIARVYGYHRLPSVLPPGAGSAHKPEDIFKYEKIAKDFTLAFGYNEVLPYTMISERAMKSLGEDKGLKIANPLSADMEYMRTCLLPGLLQTVQENENNFSEGKIFEIGRVYLPKKGDLPEQPVHFAGLNWGSSELFYQAKGFALGILEKFGIKNFELKDNEDKIFHPARAMDIYAGKDYIGSFGEIHPASAKKFGIENRVGFFYFYFDELVKFAQSHKSYSPIPEYPGVKRDISFVLDKKIEHEKIKEAILRIDALVAEAKVFDVYAGGKVGEDNKSMAYHILFRSPHRTLEAKEIDAIWEKITKALETKLQAKIRK